MEYVYNSVKGYAANIRDNLTPILKVSKFQEGLLTPNEFVEAGDFLGCHCRVWKWATGDEIKIAPFLPKERQFLIAKNVKIDECYTRSEKTECKEAKEKIVEADDGQGGWVNVPKLEKDGAEALEFVESHFEMPCSPPNVVSDDEFECMDLVSFSENAVKFEISIPNRTYDLHITYDQYYQTPRLWIFGYDKNQNPLPTSEIVKTFTLNGQTERFTIKAHPHLSLPENAAIYNGGRPAEVMKKVIENASEVNCEFFVYQYLTIFLKITQKLIPEILCDDTLLPLLNPNLLECLDKAYSS